MQADLAIVGGIVVTGTGAGRADLLVHRGRIAEVEPAGGDVGAHRTIDAGGLLVMPGMVDTHVHLMDPGPTEREDFPTGTAAAAARGVTTIVEHTHAHPVRDRVELAEKVAYLRGRSNVSFGLAAHVWPDRIDGLEEAWRAGVAFFKVFTCTTHGVPGIEGEDLRRTMERVAGFGGTCLVHAEDETRTEEAERALHSAGRTDPGILTEWRSREAELVAVQAVAELAVETGARLTIAHVSPPGGGGRGGPPPGAGPISRRRHAPSTCSSRRTRSSGTAPCVSLPRPLATTPPRTWRRCGGSSRTAR